MLPAVSCKSGSGKSPTRLALLAGLGVLSVLAGCGRSDMAAVSGKVTLDGQPLENAFLEFVPTGDKGSVSSGRTNAAGEYELMFSRDTRGAFLGPHKVRITTKEITVDEKQREVWLPEKVPARYNAQTELTRDVEPGENRFDFDLKSS
jgi:hypothetical protein